MIFCFERRYLKQNSVISLKSSILPPPNFWAAYATERMVETHSFAIAIILALHHKHMKLVKPFAPHIIACSVRKVFLSVDL